MWDDRNDIPRFEAAVSPNSPPLSRRSLDVDHVSNEKCPWNSETRAVICLSGEHSVQCHCLLGAPCRRATSSCR